ncbi:hypothetical protein CLF_105805 [Clonorchis sinensis]|uniref:Uncharacterized protein n=1 Tax=Clonorchis sinensis TaxID=79923 RepID=G7YE85_CLOSI|nr:hypothetical protein CLF_105805 [Clonorchis sinensis]
MDHIRICPDAIDFGPSVPEVYAWSLSRHTTTSGLTASNAVTYRAPPLAGSPYVQDPAGWLPVDMFAELGNWLANISLPCEELSPVPDWVVHPTAHFEREPHRIDIRRYCFRFPKGEISLSITRKAGQSFSTCLALTTSKVPLRGVQPLSIPLTIEMDTLETVLALMAIKGEVSALTSKTGITYGIKKPYDRVLQGNNAILDMASGRRRTVYRTLDVDFTDDMTLVDDGIAAIQEQSDHLAAQCPSPHQDVKYFVGHDKELLTVIGGDLTIWCKNNRYVVQGCKRYDAWERNTVFTARNAKKVHPFITNLHSVDLPIS